MTATVLPPASAVGRQSPARAWSAVASLALGAFVIVTTEFLPVGFLPQIADSLQVSLGTAGLVVLVPGLSAALSAPLILVVARRVDRRWVITGLGILVAASNTVSAMAPTFSVVLPSRVLLGVALAGFWTVVPPIGAKLVGDRLGTRATSIIIGGVSAGTVLGLPAGQFLGNVLGWRQTFAATAAVALVIAIAQLLLLPSIQTRSRTRFRDYAGLLRLPITRAGLLAISTVFIGQFAASTFITPFLLSHAQLSSGQVTALFFGYGAAGIAGTLVGSPLVARNLTTTFAVAAAGVGVTLLALPVVVLSGTVVGVLIIAWGLLWGVIPLATQVWLLRAAPDAQEPASALNVSTMQISIALGAALGGGLVDSAGVPLVFTVGGVIVVVAAALTITVGRTAARPTTNRPGLAG